MRRVDWSPRALHDLRRRFSYLLAIDAALAARTVAIIDRRADWIAEHPSLGSPFRGRQRKSLVPGSPYLIFYSYDDAAVRILRIRHAAENWLPR